MARTRRRERAGAPQTDASLHGEPEDPTVDSTERGASPDWRWRTFPVLCAFVVGLLIASFVNAPPQNDAAAALVIVALLGLGYCLAHLFVMNVIVAGRIKRRREALSRGDIPEEDYETEIVYPGNGADAATKNT